MLAALPEHAPASFVTLQTLLCLRFFWDSGVIAEPDDLLHIAPG
jgi:hypothetical protein